MKRMGGKSGLDQRIEGPINEVDDESKAKARLSLADGAVQCGASAEELRTALEMVGLI